MVEYAGDHTDKGTARDLETSYAMDVTKGCYMYHFKHKGKQYCVDAHESVIGCKIGWQILSAENF